MIVTLAACTPSEAPGQSVPGLPGYRDVRTLDLEHCGAVAETIVRDPSAPVSPQDVALVAMLAVDSPWGLDFAADRDRSRERVANWIGELQTRLAAATTAYGAGSDAASAARLVQAYRHAASTLLHAQLPVDVRSGADVQAKITAFCGNLAVVAQPLVAQADAAAVTCRERATHAGAGWWSTVCAP